VVSCLEVWLEDIRQGVVDVRDDWLGNEWKVDGVRDPDATLVEVHLHHIQLEEPHGQDKQHNTG